MARLTAADRRGLKPSQFAIPEKAPGSGSYPLPDAAHGRSALQLVGANGTPAEKARVRAEVKRKFPEIGRYQKP